MPGHTFDVRIENLDSDGYREILEEGGWEPFSTEGTAIWFKKLKDPEIDIPQIPSSSLSES